MNNRISVLDSGCTVVTSSMKERKSVSIGLWVRAGGRYESGRPGGISHFLEHLVFKGTESRSAMQIKEAVEGVGGSLNAFTGEEYTCFLAKCASRHLHRSFDVLADMVQNATLKQGNIDKERTVILEEIKMVQDQPSQLVEEILARLLWKGHPLGDPLAGSYESVRSITRKDLTNYRGHFYEPSRMIVSIAGDITHREAVNLCRQIIIKPSADPVPFTPAAFEKCQTSHEVSLLEKKTEQSHLAIGFHALPKDDPDEYVLDMMNVVLGGNMSSRLFNEVREKRGLAYEISSFVRRFEETGSFQVSAGIDNKKTTQAFAVILSEIKKLKTRPVPPDELQRAKEFYLGQMHLALESSMNQMLWAGENLLLLGRLKSPELISKAILRVNSRDILRLARRIFLPRGANIALIGPESKALEKAIHKETASLN